MLLIQYILVEVYALRSIIYNSANSYRTCPLSLLLPLLVIYLLGTGKKY